MSLLDAAVVIPWFSNTTLFTEEDDLLANYTNAYKPNGCNEKVGG